MMTRALVGTVPAATGAEPVESETMVAAESAAAATGPQFVLPVPVTEEELAELPVAPVEGESDEAVEPSPASWAMAMPLLLAVSVPPPPPPPPLVTSAGSSAVVALPTAAAAEPMPVAPLPVAAEPPRPEFSADQPALPPSGASAQPVVMPALARSAMSTEPIATVAPSEPTGRGTVGAKEVEPMQAAEQTERIAEPAEQNLPRGKFVPVLEAARAVESAEARPVMPPPVGRRLPALDRTAAVAAAVAAERPVRWEAASAVTEARPPAAVEKVFTDISQQVVSFKRVGALTAEVQVRPDRQTEITLQWNVRAGQVEVTAQLERGDYDGLRAHWAGLQESLAQQGVRLGPLQPTAAALDDRFGGGGQAAPQFHDRTFRDFEWERGGEPAAGGARLNPAKPERAVAAGGRGWERWA
jgi:hypothetical protein